MSLRTRSDLSRSERRRAMRLGYVNGALWAVGNGLTTGPLLIYFAIELGVSGAEIGYILAMPAVVGLLRLLAPTLIRRLGGYKPAALAMYLPAYALMACLPCLAIPAFADSPLAIQSFVLLNCAHQLFEYTGAVALWAWLAEIVPRQVRGRYFAGRQRWQLLALIPTILASAWFADYWKAAQTGSQLWVYAIPIGVGSAFLLASLIPLLWIPNLYCPAPAGSANQSGLLASLTDGRFQRLLLFGCWISFFNGFTQTAQNVFPRRMLDLSVSHLVWLRVLMQVGQIALTPWVGYFSDRYGNRPTLFVCQLIVATGPLFYLAATPSHPWWIVGAWIVFSAYVGLNVCLPNLMLKLSPGRERSAYVATYFAVTGLTYAIAMIAGDWLFDFLQFHSFDIGPFARLDRYGYLFYTAWATRTLAVVLLLGVVEPGAWSWREILSGRRASHAAKDDLPEPA